MKDKNPGRRKETLSGVFGMTLVDSARLLKLYATVYFGTMGLCLIVWGLANLAPVIKSWLTSSDNVPRQKPPK